jgi:hypothetical protein
LKNARNTYLHAFGNAFSFAFLLGSEDAYVACGGGGADVVLSGQGGGRGTEAICKVVDTSQPFDLTT